jgi:hypothetical protein
MNKLAHGFLIRPKQRDIVSVLHDVSNYKEIYKLIECDDSPFTLVYIDDRNVIFVDDEGLLKDARHYFNVEGHPFPIAGIGLVLGTDPEGETTSTSLSLPELQAKVSFTERKLLGFKVEEGITDVLGKPGWGIQSTPIFGPPEGEK